MIASGSCGWGGATRTMRPVSAASPFVVAQVIVCLFAGAAAAVDERTGEPEYVVVQAGRVITVSGEEFAPGVIVIEDGKISAVGKDLEYPPAAKLINAPGETVMPGFVLAWSRFGLSSFSRSGVHGDRRAADEIYPDETDWHELVEAGITTVAMVPGGSDIPGSAGVYHTAGRHEDRLIAESAYLRVAPDWAGGGKKTLRSALKKAQEEIEKVEKARKEWEEKQKAAQKKNGQDKKDEPEKKDDKGNGGDGGKKRHTANGNDNGQDEEKEEPDAKDAEGQKQEPEEFKPPEIDPKYQPLVDWIQKKEGASLMVELSGAADLLHLDDVLDAYDEWNTVFFVRPGREYTGANRARFGYGGEFLRSDFHHVVDNLGRRKAEVVLAPTVHYLPDTTFRYNLMAELLRAGCDVSIVPHADTLPALRRLRARLAEVMRSGVERKAALASLTVAPACAVGLGDRLGGLEKGKHADLVFFDGDPLDPHSRIQRVMILGETVWEAE